MTKRIALTALFFSLASIAFLTAHTALACELTPITVQTCTGTGELFLYENDQTHVIDTTFVVNHTQLLIFTRYGVSPTVEVNGTPATLSVERDISSPFPVRIFSLATAPGDTITVTGSDPLGARTVQGYLSQDASAPAYDISTLQVVFDAEQTNVVSLTAGTYSYVIFDKYNYENDTVTDDSRAVTVNVSGPSGTLVDTTYTKPSPASTMGAVVGSFTVNPGAEGSHTLSLSTEDSVYWPLMQCPIPATNHPPIVTGPTEATGTTCSAVEFMVSMIDPDGDPLTVTADLPPLAVFSTSTGEFSWLPSATGTYTATFHVSDGQATTSLPVTITVTECADACAGNFAPILTGPTTATGTVGTPVEFMVSMIDPDGDPLTVTADLPPLAVFSTSTGEFSWLPSATGTYVATFSTFDGCATTTMTVTIIVTAAPSACVGNHPPIMTGPTSATGTIGSPVEFMVSMIDPDGDPLTVTADLPPLAVFSTSTGEFSWLPGAYGTYTATFTTSDGCALTTMTVTITVPEPVEPPPVCTSNCGGGSSNVQPRFTVAPASFCWSSGYSYDVNAVDIDGDPITYTLTAAPTGMAIGVSTGHITWDPGQSAVSATPYSVTVQASDGRNAPAVGTYDLTVTNCGGGGTPTSTPTSTVAGTSTVNLPPYFTDFNPKLDAPSCTLYSYQVKAVDPEGAPLTYTLVEAPYGMSFAPLSATVFWQPTAAQKSALPYRVTIQVSDGVNSVSVTYQIFVSSNSACFVPSQPRIQGVSTSTVTSTPPVCDCTCSTTTAAGPGFFEGFYLGALGLIAGLGDLIGAGIGWIISHYCLLALLLLILTLLAFIAYVVHTAREKKRMREALAANGAPEVAPDILSEDLIFDEDLGDATMPLPGFDSPARE